MLIYLLHRVYHEYRGEITWYVVTPYCEYETALRVVMSDTGKISQNSEKIASVISDLNKMYEECIHSVDGMVEILNQTKDSFDGLLD